MKTCPKCNHSWPEDYECCPACGADLPATNNRPSASVGDNNTFTGGVNSTDNRTTTNSNNVTQTNSNNTTTYTTINEAPKSSGQLLNENKLSYRLECKKLYKNGLISKEGEERLRELQAALGLADELVLPIKEEIQQKSKKPMGQLSAGVLKGIRETKTVIEQNFFAELNRKLQQLDSWMKEYEDDALKSYYFQLFSMLEPTRYTEMYEQSAKDEYWEVYWAYIAYLLQNKEKQAYDAQASLGRLEDDYPEQNEVLLTLAGRLIQNAREDSINRINQDYNTRTIYCSQELKLLLDSIDELLHKDWTAEPPIVICGVHSFYVNTLFKSFVETQREIGMNRRIEIERLNRVERGKQIELQRQKDLLLGQFQEKKDIDQACNILGIPYLTFKEWQNEDSTFDSRYNEIVRRIEAERSEEAERIRLAQELEERIRQQKAQFKLRYEKNGCDFAKTCSVLGIDSDTAWTWRRTDKAFDDGLTVIEREHEKQLQELFVQFYESNGCDLQKACTSAGVSVERVNGWRKSDKEFDGVLTAIDNEHVQEIKKAFVKCYHDNECNLLKTCSETGIDSSVYRDWLNSDRTFADKIKYIETEINKKRKSEEDRINREHNKKRWDKFKKSYLPIILSAALLVAIYLIVRPIVSQRIERKAAQTEIINQHSALLIDFDSDCARVNEEAGLEDFKESIESIETILSQIKILEASNPSIIKPQYDSLSRKATSLCKNLHTSMNNKASETMDENEVIEYSEKIKCVDSTEKRIELSNN